MAFDSHIIHSLNKNEAAAIDDHPYWAEVASRPNVILLGDSLTDMQVRMVDIGHVLCISAVR